MPFKLVEVKEDGDFLPLWFAFREGFTKPGNALWPLFMGDWRPDEAAARESALQESCSRFLSWHRADPTSTWLQVIDEDTGEIAAGGRWSIFTERPYDNHGHMEATWYPPDEPREVASKFLNQFLGTACRNANRPHAFLNILFTVPKYRRKGAASLIMDWGFERAQTAGLDVYIEATKEGKPLYEKYGLHPIEVSSFQVDGQKPQHSSNSVASQEVINALTPFTWWSMVKTVG